MPTFREQLKATGSEKAWEYVAGKYRQAKRCFAAEVAASWVADTVFFLCACVICYGVIPRDFPIDKSYTQSFAQSISTIFPLIQSLWERYSQWLLGLETDARTMQLLTVALIVLVPAACAVPVALVVRWMNHPEQPELPQGTRQEKAKAMLETAQKARNYTKRAGHSGMGFYGVVFVLVALTFFSYVLLGTPVGGMILKEGNFEMGKAVGLWIAGVFVTYGALCWLVRLLITPLYFCCVPKGRLEDLQWYCREVTEMENSESLQAKE